MDIDQIRPETERNGTELKGQGGQWIRMKLGKMGYWLWLLMRSAASPSRQFFVLAVIFDVRGDSFLCGLLILVTKTLYR